MLPLSAQLWILAFGIVLAIIVFCVWALGQDRRMVLEGFPKDRNWYPEDKAVSSVLIYCANSPNYKHLDFSLNSRDGRYLHRHIRDALDELVAKGKMEKRRHPAFNYYEYRRAS